MGCAGVSEGTQLLLDAACARCGRCMQGSSFSLFLLAASCHAGRTTTHREGGKKAKGRQLHAVQEERESGGQGDGRDGSCVERTRMEGTHICCSEKPFALRAVLDGDTGEGAGRAGFGRWAHWGHWGFGHRGLCMESAVLVVLARVTYIEKGNLRSVSGFDMCCCR